MYTAAPVRGGGVSLRSHLVLQGEAMCFLVAEQVWAVVMFLLGSIILNICSKWERKDQAILKEAKSYG